MSLLEMIMWIKSEFGNNLVNLDQADQVYLDKDFYEGDAVIAEGRGGVNEDTGMFCVLFCSKDSESAKKYLDDLFDKLETAVTPSPWQADPTAEELPY